jgi:hypothetical protein
LAHACRELSPPFAGIVVELLKPGAVSAWPNHAPRIRRRQARGLNRKQPATTGNNKSRVALLSAAAETGAWRCQRAQQTAGNKK